MNETLAVIQILSALLTFVTRATAAAARATKILMTARGAEREVSSAELADLAAESDQLTRETLAVLREAAQR
jgi:hypothetical protein